MKNYHIIKIKYLGPIDTLGSRIKLTSERFENNSVVISYDYNFNNALDIAISWLNSHGYSVIGQAEGQNIAGYAILSSDGNGFEKLYK